MKHPFPYLNYSTPEKQRTIIPVNWLQHRDSLNPHHLPLYIRWEGRWKAGLLTLLGLTFIFGMIIRLPALTATAGALLLVLHFKNRQAVLALDALNIEAITAPHEVKESEAIHTLIKVFNDGPTTIANAVICIDCSACKQSRIFITLEPIPARKTIKVQHSFVADCGMGEFYLGPITLAVSDVLGFGTYAYQHQDFKKIDVRPEEILLSKFQVRRPGRAIHGGTYDISTVGKSPSFLGLREWRCGDPLRYIDWKRSVRTGALLVKEFEASVAIDASLICEDFQLGHSQYGSISSQESLRDSMIAISRCLFKQQIRQQCLTSQGFIPMGLDFDHFHAIVQAVYELKFQSQERIHELLAKLLPIIPPDSICILGFASMQIDVVQLMPHLIDLEKKNVDFALVVIDSAAFARAIRSEAKLEEGSQQLAAAFGQDSNFSSREIRKIISKLADRTYVIGPSQTIADVYNQVMGI